LINGCSKEFSMSTYLVLLKHPLRTLFWCLVLGGALFLWLHPGAHSSAQNLAPELATGKLNTPREGHSATLLQNGKVLVAGGRNGGEVTNTAELYDPATGQWTPTANTLAQARHGHSAVLLRSGQVLVIGGQGANNSYLNSAEIYDPADNSWKSALGSQMNVARHHATATLLNTGRVLVVGGVNSAGVQRSAEIYNPVTLKWTRTDVNNAAGNLSEARAEHTATLLTDGRVLVAGGIGSAGAALRSTELYEPGANRWRRVGDLLTQRASHTATLLPDGTVLAAGGANGATAHSSAELFTPATGAWMATGALAPRFAHTATLLPNGRVVVAGGKADATRSLSSVQVYNYLDKKWSDAPQAPPFANQAFALLEARSAHTATLLTNGQLLFVGGRPGSDAPSCTSSRPRIGS
jgi:N-acetylneuraminic acid mutarotase